MAPTIFHLLSLKQPADPSLFLQALRSTSPDDKPLWVGHCEHWIHEPSPSLVSLVGTGERIKSWDYLVVFQVLRPDSLDLPDGLAEYVSEKWAITTDVDDTMLDTLVPKVKNLPTTVNPILPDGWSAGDHRGLDEHETPQDLVLSLATTSRPLHHNGSADEVDLKSFARTFGTVHSGPVAMFNLLSFFPGKVEEYMKYVAAFGDISYGGEPLAFGLGVQTWSSEKSDSIVAWHGVGLIWYPSIWNFAKMLADPRYASLDRQFKRGVILDNPVLCCVKIEL
ncbi:hypothetical protein BX600DRAFT_473516 [Xylariales sp. PMI_506]|nr:hypothetical protein BX600DRAFT_473516 [Xylariales sp. PMI_506]